MKQTVTALVGLMLLCTACARGEEGTADSTVPAAESDAASEESTSPSEVGADSETAGATPPIASTRMGITHQVGMTGDAEGFRFDPSDLTIAEGEAIRFIVTGGGPHNVVFDGQNLTSDVQTRLDQQISDRTSPLTSGMLTESGEAVTVSFAGIPSGRYSFFCATHGSAGMKGTVTVQ